MSDERTIEARIYERLSKVIDPELGRSVTDLGMIAAIDATPVAGETNTYDVRVRVELTVEGCPLSQTITNQINGLIGGAFVVETVFLIPGMGKSMVDAINQRDNPVVMGLSMAVVITVVIVNLVADILNAYIDPRITFSEK